MKQFFIFLFILFLPAASIGQKAKDSSTEVKGKYMGQKPPGLKPVIFAPGFISTDGSEFNPVYTPDWKEFYFSDFAGEECFIKYTKQVNGVWTKPVIAPFSGEYGDVDISVSYDGKKMFWGSDRPVTPGGKPADQNNIWMIERNESGFGEPVLLKNGINQGNHQVFPCPAESGNLYFQSKRPGNIDTSAADIYMAEWKDGKYLEPVNLGPNINSEYWEGDIFIAPDESWLIVSVSGNPESYGRGDFFISFRNADGSWQKRIHMVRTTRINDPVINQYLLKDYISNIQYAFH